ncbi:MAG: DUF4837 family protein [Bacteroidales bacterium]|nr:DUF4837 family protein [Bacteroidales bacterium]
MVSKYYLNLLVLLSLASCLDSERYSLQPASSGSPGDILLVMNTKLWEGAPGNAIKNTLYTPFDGLPQDEPSYDILQINHAGFGKTYKTQRNIIIAKIGADQPESKILVHKNTWAKSQLIISVLASSDSAFVDLVNNNSNKILALLSDTERKRLMQTYKATRDEKIREKLEEKYFIGLNVPRGYKMDVEKSDFIWISHEYRDIIQGIFVYSYKYTDENTFTSDYLVDKRNKILKKYVSGEIEGSYMTTEALYPPIFSEYRLKNKYTAEIRGLWKMVDGLAMGGPFVSISQLDETRNRVVTIEGFVFAPAHEKRDLLRQLEAIVLSIEIVE